MPQIVECLASLNAQIAEAATSAGRAESDIELVAVSKMHPPEAVAEALDAGQAVFGESRVQEARAKIPQLPSRARWHFIGHLQKNKIRHALALGFELFHGIDSLDLARDLNHFAEEAGLHPRLLLEVNVAGESTKFGFSASRLRTELEALVALDRLQIEGLMTIAPLAPDAEHSRRYFAALRELRDQLQEEFRVSLPRLSMGMSGDFKIAIEEGATLVRIGTAIFGTRRGKGWRPETGPATFGD